MASVAVIKRAKEIKEGQIYRTYDMSGVYFVVFITKVSRATDILNYYDMQDPDYECTCSYEMALYSFEKIQ